MSKIPSQVKLLSLLLQTEEKYVCIPLHPRLFQLTKQRVPWGSGIFSHSLHVYDMTTTLAYADSSFLKCFSHFWYDTHFRNSAFGFWLCLQDLTQICWYKPWAFEVSDSWNSSDFTRLQWIYLISAITKLVFINKWKKFHLIYAKFDRLWFILLSGFLVSENI